jgi:quinol---cytochrome c reductase iron-sulfur subunit, bacillus type
LNPDEMSEQDPLPEPHLPPPTIWPIGFAVGIALLLVGLIINPLWISTIGGAIAIVFGLLWARGATTELRGHAVHVEPEQAEFRDAAAAAGAAPEGGERFPRDKFLEGATLGLGAVIGGIVTVPALGFAVLPAFLHQKGHEVDLGPLANFDEGQWYIATFMLDPHVGVVSRRTAFVRNNGSIKVEGGQAPSFTIISNRCAHLGCPVQANGPTGAILGMKDVIEQTDNGKITLSPTLPAGFGCPCHGGQYDTEGNRTAGPPTRALDRYGFKIDNGNVVLLSMYSVSKVEGTGAQAQIHKYKFVGPGEHVDGVEQVFYPLNPPHH